MIAIIDYGVGNLFSLTASLRHLNIDNQVTRDRSVIDAADGIILPGVGAFGDAADRLKQLALKDFLTEQAHSGKPFLGICLGMQLLFEKSYEYGEHEGLGLLPGYVDALRQDLPSEETLVPHMGWNELHIVRRDRIIAHMAEGTHTYFVHSYYAKECTEALIADAEYEGIRIPAIVGTGNVYGMQFHPEKSGRQGLELLKQFSRLCQSGKEQYHADLASN